MKIIGINGSPRKDGNTSILIRTVFEELEAEGIETELVDVGVRPVRGCVACNKCWDNRDRHCAITGDALNGILDKILASDGVILGSPVYCADLCGQMKSFVDRASMVACANGSMFRRKVGASVVAVRRAGALSAFHSLNSFFTIGQMIIVGSSYWNMGYGMDPGEVAKDAEGMQTMRTLGKNMAWLLKVMKAGRAGLPEPETTAKVLTNFIR